MAWQKNGRDLTISPVLRNLYYLPVLKAAAAFVAKSSTTTTCAGSLWSGFVDSQGAAPKFVEFKASIAAVDFSWEDIFTKLNPREWQVNLSLITLADATVPCAENTSVNSSWVVEYGKPPTYSFEPMGGSIPIISYSLTSNFAASGAILLKVAFLIEGRLAHAFATAPVAKN